MRTNLFARSSLKLDLAGKVDPTRKADRNRERKSLDYAYSSNERSTRSCYRNYRKESHKVKRKEGRKRKEEALPLLLQTTPQAKPKKCIL